MINSLFLACRSITGRLYAAVGILSIALVATNLMTVVYSDTVTTGAGIVLHESIDGVRIADEFDDLLDQHRRTVTTQADTPALGQAETETTLTKFEWRLSQLPKTSHAAGVLSADLSDKLIAHVAQLKSLARAALNAMVAARDASEVAPALESFLTYTNEVEEDVTGWKTQMREATVAELTTMTKRAGAMRKLYYVVTAGACLIGLAAVLLSRSVLRRLHKLAKSMLSLADGNIAMEVPSLSDRDEIGLLANALEVFRENAGRAIANEANLSAALESMAEGIAIFSTDGIIALHNQKYVDLFRLPRRDCAGMAADDIHNHLIKEHNWPAETIREVNERMANVMSGESADTFGIDLPDLRSYAITAAKMPNGKLLVSIADVSESRISAERIFHLAHHDPLTGLPNRAAFLDRLSLAVDDAITENGISAALLLCDLDHFKEVNDTYGHPAGDELLRQTAARIRETMRKTDVLARLGGDEFAIIHLCGSEPLEAQALAARVVANLRQPFDLDGNRVCIGVSVGIAHAPVDTASPVELLKQADLALYAAKRSGRDMFALYDAGMSETLAERRSLEAEMRMALNTDGFHLHYQPQIELQSGRIIGFEALARWNNRVRGLVPPSVFIPIAEESGLIIAFGEWVLRKACADAAAWGGETSIAVNVASQQFRHEGFVDLVRSVLDESGLPPHRLELEITETAMLNDGEEMLAVLLSLRSMGVRLSVDDFGTGYSALSYLQKFPFDKIKIDQSFVRDLGNQGHSDAIVRAVAGLGVNLGIKILAEGVETEQQSKLVVSAACDEAQGYLYGRPGPASEVVILLKRVEEPIAA